MTNTITSLTGSTTTASQPASAADKANIDYDSFLKLFMAQMKDQDPTKPNDPTATLSQLASFSNVEQSIKLNEKLDSMLSVSNATLASGLVGKAVSSLDGAVSGIAVSVASGANGLEATLKDGRTLSLGAGYRIGAA